MKNVIVKKENGEVRIITATEQLVQSIEKEYSTNPCIECKKGTAVGCSKVADVNNKDITRYDYITDGYQIYDSLGRTERLVVCKCSNFVKDLPRKKPTTREEIRDLIRLKESLKILYFSAGSVEEADRKQAYLMSRGLLTEYNPRLK